MPSGGNNFIDLTGKTFGNLKVLCRSKNINNKVYWHCICDCGKEKDIFSGSLLKGKTTTCGCRNRKYGENIVGKKYGKLKVLEDLSNDEVCLKEHLYKCICECGNIENIRRRQIKKRDCCMKCSIDKKSNEMIGKRFGRWTVIKRVENDKNNKRRFLCKCDCGNEKIVSGAILSRGESLSCGCYKKEVLTKPRNKNKYDLSGDYGIGYYLDKYEFYFDLEDYDKIKDYYWCVNYSSDSPHVYTVSNNKTIWMHRLLLNLNAEDNFVDHIDRNGLNNRKYNIRTVTHIQNDWNHGISSNNSSGHKGVIRTKVKDIWYWRGEVICNKKSNTKSFSINKYGEGVAYNMACKWQEEKDLELKGEYSYYFNHSNYK